MATKTHVEPRTRGFTLLEAMVALIIVALGMMAVNTQLNRYAAASFYVEQKTLTRKGRKLAEELGPLLRR